MKYLKNYSLAVRSMMLHLFAKLKILMIFNKYIRSLMLWYSTVDIMLAIFNSLSTKVEIN
jgi:hypothetical protein